MPSAKLVHVVNQYNKCPLCHGPLKKNGKYNNKQRWRCKDSTCGYSFSNTNEDAIDAKRFRIFQQWLLSSNSMTEVAQQHKRNRRTLTRWFEPFWYIQVPNNIDPNRVYDQIFIDGTYFKNQCLLVASSKHHVIAWHWCKHENSYSYNRLLDKIPHPPTVVTADGHAGALKAIRDTWPSAQIQRCLIHVKRNIQQYVGRNPS